MCRPVRTLASFGENIELRLYSYIVSHDTGFAPNPFWGYCTLANCKPVIRRTAQIGDWLVGLSPKCAGNKLIYAMKIEEVLPYCAYFGDGRFAAKIPDYTKGTVVCKCGDNVYAPLPDGGFLQLPSTHSNGTEENLGTKARDLGGKNVLISKTFYYFGSQACPLPPALDCLKVGRAHKNRFSQDTIFRFLHFISDKTAGINAPPTCWPHDDESWKTAGP